MKQPNDPYQNRPLLSDELKLLKIAKLFLNSFKGASVEVPTGDNQSTLVKDIAINKDISTSDAKEAQLESAMRASADYLISKS